MAIDNCDYSFGELASTRLPMWLDRLKHQVENPISAQSLAGFKSATKSALKVFERTKDFPGCYVFLHDSKPVYVGISRTVVKRLTQHLNHVSHYSASLVYRTASKEYPHELKRDQAMKDGKFYAAFLTAQLKLNTMSFAFVEITNDLELYLFEAYAAMEFDTSTWNTFRTH